MRRGSELGPGALFMAAFLWWAGSSAALAGDGPGTDPGSTIHEGPPTIPLEKESPAPALQAKPPEPKRPVKPVLRPNEDATLRDPKTGDAGIAVPPETAPEKGKR
jgi:hypothetical protein